MSREERSSEGRSAGFGMLTSPPALLGCAAALLTLLLGLWARSATPDPRQVPIISGDGRFLYLGGIMASVVLGFATTWLVRMRRTMGSTRDWVEQYTAPKQMETSWILPALTILGAFLLVARYHRGQDIAAAMLLAGSGVFAAITVRESLSEQDVAPTAPVRLAQIILTLGVAFVVFALVLLYRTRTLYAGPVVFGAGFLLLLQAQDGIPSFPIRRVAYALVGAVALAQATWALNAWPPSGWWAGGVLASMLLGYTVISGAQLAGRLSRELAINSAGIAAILLAACAFLAR